MCIIRESRVILLCLLSIFSIIQPYKSPASQTPIELKEDFLTGLWYIASEEPYERLHLYREHGIDIARIYEYNFWVNHEPVDSLVPWIEKLGECGLLAYQNTPDFPKTPYDINFKRYAWKGWHPNWLEYIKKGDPDWYQYREDFIDEADEYFDDLLYTWGDLWNLAYIFFWHEAVTEHHFRQDKTDPLWPYFWFDMQDSLGVGSTLKYIWESKGASKPFWLLQGWLTPLTWQVDDRDTTCNYTKLFASWKYKDTSGSTHDNPMHHISFGNYTINAVHPDTIISNAERWTQLLNNVEVFKTSVDSVQGEMQIWPWTQTQGIYPIVEEKNWASVRTPLPQEIEASSNLEIMLGCESLLYFQTGSFTEPYKTQDTTITLHYFGLLDNALALYDAPFEDYVYERNHDWYPDPDTLLPFRWLNYSLPEGISRENSTYDEWKFSEGYYLWKYLPYADRWNDLTRINAHIHVISSKLGQQDPDTTFQVFIEDAECSGRDYALHVKGFQGDDYRKYIYLVNTYFDTLSAGDTVYLDSTDVKVCLKKDDLNIPQNKDYYLVDCSKRKMLETSEEYLPDPDNPQVQSLYVTFEELLAAGEGRLVQIYITDDAQVMPDFCIADFDITLSHQNPSDTSSVFYKGDNVRITADVYNLNPEEGDTVTVSFYAFYDNSAHLLANKKTYIPALSDSGQSLGTTFITGPANHIGPVDIIVRFAAHTYSDRDTLNNAAHRLLLLHPEDYALHELDNPWDMEGIGWWDSLEITNDITDWSENIIRISNYVSDAWESKFRFFEGDTAGWLQLHVDENDPIDGSKYDHLKLRMYSVLVDTSTVIYIDDQESSPVGTDPPYGFSVTPLWYWENGSSPDSSYGECLALKYYWGDYEWNLEQEGNWNGENITALKLLFIENQYPYNDKDLLFVIPGVSLTAGKLN